MHPALKSIELSFPTLLLLLAFRLVLESSRKADNLVSSSFPRFASTYLESHTKHLEMSLSESKGVLRREHFGLSNVCIYNFFGFKFFKGKQYIVLQLQLA